MRGGSDNLTFQGVSIDDNSTWEPPSTRDDRLALQRESRGGRGRPMPDHVHIPLPVRRNIRFRRSWATSRAKAPFIWPEPMGAEEELRGTAHLGEGTFRPTVGRDGETI